MRGLDFLNYNITINLPISMKIKPRPLDFAALFFGVVVLILFSFTTYRNYSGIIGIQVTANSEKSFYPLGSDITVWLRGPLGSTELRIESGEARIADSPCPDKLCIDMGRINAPGHWIACLPNRVFIEIKGKEQEKLDAHSY